MRILLTTDTVGGVWTFTRELTEQYLGLGHAVSLVAFGRPFSEPQRRWCELVHHAHRTRFEYTSCDIPLEWMRDNERAYADGAVHLLRTVRSFQPDLLHSNQFCYGKLPVNLPVLVTAHSDVLSWFAACQTEEPPPSAWLDRYIAQVQQGLAGACAICAPTVWMRNALCSNFDVPALRHVIANGSSIDFRVDESARALQAISVGRLWDEAKHISMLCQLNSPMPLLVAGEAEFGGAASPLDQTRIHWLGQLNTTDLVALFRSSRVYIATSVYEPFGLAPLEAALCGCALVLRDLASLREVWGEAARYFSSAAELACVLQDLVTDDVELGRLQVASAQHARRYTATRMATSYLDLYAKLITEHACVTEGALEPHAA